MFLGMDIMKDEGIELDVLGTNRVMRGSPLDPSHPKS